LLCLILAGLSFRAHSQVGQLELTGRATKDGSPLQGATVTVYRNGTIEQEKIKVGKNGKFRLFLVFGHDYKISFSYPGCVDMHMMVYASKLAKERSDLFPLYHTEVPFFDLSAKGVRISKYKNPFTKVIYDGQKAFIDDEAYLTAFTKDLIIDAAEQSRIAAEKEAREKAEQEKAEMIARAAKEEQERIKKQQEEAEAAIAAKEEAERAAALARMKSEAARETTAGDQTMESEAMKLQREKEEKARLAKQNTKIKTEYVNDLLKLVAENERIAKQKAFDKQKQEARTNTVIEQMRRENELKAKAENLREEQKEKRKKVLENKQIHRNEIRKLAEAAAFAERTVRISNQQTLPDPKSYVAPKQPNVAVTIEDGVLKDIRTTVVTIDKKIITYRKEISFWGTVSCYKDDKVISQATYNAEVAYYSSYRIR
jgi:hypothetical protein